MYFLCLFYRYFEAAKVSPLLLGPPKNPDKAHAMNPTPALTLLLPADSSLATQQALANWCTQAEPATCAWLCGPADLNLPLHPRLYNATEPLPLAEALPLLPWHQLVIAGGGELYTFKVRYPV